MHIEQHGTLKQFNPKPGTPNQEAYTVVQVVVPTAQFTEPEQIADGYRYVGHRVRLTLHAEPLPVAMSEPRPMEKLWSSNGGGEHTRPGPTESCSACGRVIGDDPDAAFYTPIAGPPRPVCGECAAEPENVAELLDAQAAGADADESMEPGSMEDIARSHDGADEDEPIGDAPFPERPADAAPVTTPIRRGRARAESAS